MRLPDGNGVEVCREIRSAHPEMAYLMLTSYADDEAVFSAIVAGAAAYVLKQIRGTELVDGSRVARGESLLDPDVTIRVLDQVRSEGEDKQVSSPNRKNPTPHAHRRRHHQPRDRRTLYLTEKTVKNYVSNVLAKLGMNRRARSRRLRRQGGRARQAVPLIGRSGRLGH